MEEKSSFVPNNELELTTHIRPINQEIPMVRFRDNIFNKKFGTSPYDSEDRVKVEFFSNEKSTKERLVLYFIKNRYSSVRIRTFNLMIKLLACLLYVIRVHQDDSLSKGQFEKPHSNLFSISSNCWNKTNKYNRQSAEDFRINPCINWDAIVYIKTPLGVWIAQVVCAIISYTQTLLMTYLTYKGNIIQSILQVNFLLDTFTSFTLICTIWWPPLRYIFIPLFLNCWLAKRQLENSFNDLHRAMQKSHSALAQRLMVLSVTMFCLVFTGACAVQHIQRGGNKQINLFESFWYIIVTFSTVGYGDIYPDIWPSQLFMIGLIITVLVVLPSQFEQLALIYMEKQKRGTSYSKHRAESEKHVVVCSTTLQYNIIMDFLNEFYAHPMLKNFYVVLMSPSELNQDLAMTLQVPLWSERVIYLQGSALNNSDLNRAQMEKAKACFILASRNYQERHTADQTSILRSWAIRDYAPNCIQYVHLLNVQNKMHIQHAKYLVEDEFKYALLANNCLCPGLSTFMTLLLHTSRGDEGSESEEEWQKLYGKCSGNEIYHIKLGESQFFKEYVDKSFTFASFHAHRKYGIALISCQRENESIKLNPGPNYVMKASDICFYMSHTKEENSSLQISEANNYIEEEPNVSSNSAKKIRKQNNLSTSNLNETKVVTNINVNNEHYMVTDKNKYSINKDEENLNEANLVKNEIPKTSKLGKEYIMGVPPNPPYVGCSSTVCHILSNPPELCCLKLNQSCEHLAINQIHDYKWKNKTIILAAKDSNIAIYNFIVPLRSYSINKNSLHPILLLLENEPNEIFLEVIKHFPMVYYMKGSIECLEDLLRVGINEAEYLIIVNKERFQQNEEKSLEDCNTILAVQYIFRMFPKVKVCSEISDSKNMRFMQFRAYDKFSQSISKHEKIEEEKGSQISYLFRTTFASGFVFSATMLDTLLYQTFVKSYLINLVRLMLGLDQSPGSGHMSSKKITQEDLFYIKTYGRLYQNLCSTTCEIPIGLYRTDTIRKERNQPNNKYQEDKDELNKNFVKKLIDSTNDEIEKIINTRMNNLGIIQNYKFSRDENQHFSYVLINPPYDMNLKMNDIILIIRPDSLIQIENQNKPDKN